LKLSALAQLFGVENAIKSCFGLFNLFLEANQIVIAEDLHTLTFSDIATSRELLRRQVQIITSLRSNILSSDKNRRATQVREGLTLLNLYHLRLQQQNKTIDVHIIVNFL
jgi:phage FluMu protein gp41